MTTRTPSIEQHPDLVELQWRYEEAAETPTGQALEGLTFLTGLYLAISPWVVGFTDQGSLTTSNIFCGVAVALLALSFATMYGHAHRIAWVAPIIGAWTIAAPWLVSGATPSDSAITNNVIVGAVTVLCTVALMLVGRRWASARHRT